ncbi:MAG: type I restriction endonuclease [Desulfomonilaceae bacterium]
MSIGEEIESLSKKVAQVKDDLQSEEATKLALVSPFIYKVLGYDIGNPKEVVPEHKADFRDGTCDKVDYALYLNAQPVIFFECKSAGASLDKKDISQLRKYFGACLPARIGVLTNGIQYWFFTDLEQPNVMDDRPFLEFDMNDPKEHLIPELKKLTRTLFDPIAFTEDARKLKDTKEIKTLISCEFSEPSDDFAKFIAGKLYASPGKRITSAMVDRVKPLTAQAIAQHIDDTVNEIWRRGKDSKKQKTEEEGPGQQVDVTPVPETDVPTDAEKEAYQIVRAILCQSVDPERIKYRDLKKGFTVLLDDKQTKPICRLYFDKDSKEVGLLDENKAETKQVIQQPSDIYRFSEALKAVAAHYLTRPVTNGNHAEENETPGGIA